MAVSSWCVVEEEQTSLVCLSKSLLEAGRGGRVSCLGMGVKIDQPQAHCVSFQTRSPGRTVFLSSCASGHKLTP